jgi:hypothetical protein
MKRKVAITVSAMILAAQLGSPIAAQEPSLQHLTQIAALLTENDIDGLRAYLEANPDLLEGDSQLAILLRRFMAEALDIATYLAFEPDLRDALGGVAALPPASDEDEEEDVIEEGSDPGDDDEGPGDEDPDPDENPDDSIY